MRDGCIVGVLRGSDSTGIAQINSQWATRILKAPIDGVSFAGSKKVDTALGNTDSNIATILHHRAATHGSIKYDNCHPFEHETVDGNIITGVHNGTVHGFLKKEDGLEFEVDSDWLYYRISRDGAEKALGDLTSGAYALVWSDMKARTIRMAGNGERPIHFAPVLGKNIILVASEVHMLAWLANRNGMKIEKPFYPSPGTIITFDPAKDVRDFATTQILKKPVVVASSYTGADTWGNGGGRGSYDVRQHVTNAARNSAPVSGFDPKLVSRKREDENFIYSDCFGNSNLSATKFNGQEVVSFTPSGSDKVPHLKDKWDYYGDIISDTAEVGHAVIVEVDAVCTDNLNNALEADCRVIGVRVRTDKKTGQVVELILLAPPMKIVGKDDVAQQDAEDRALGSMQLALMDMEDGDEWPAGDGKPVVKGPLGRWTSQFDFANLIKNGCAVCTKSLHILDADFLKWTIDKQPVCQTCAEAEKKILSRHGLEA